jgi:hypothetical protein
MWLAYPTLIVVTEGGDRHEGSGAASWWARSQRWVWSHVADGMETRRYAR